MDQTATALTTAVAALTERAGALTDAELGFYGRVLLGGAGLYYLSTSFKAVVPADAQHAIDGHLPQGHDRSVIAARLQLRHSKAVLSSCTGLQQLREDLKKATSREAKLQGWEEVFRRTLTALLATAYIHSLTLSLFTMKNTVRVLVFVLARRQAALERKRAGNAADGAAGVVGKAKAWWKGGTQSLLMETFMSRMNASLEQQASPFANAGLDEELLPSPPPHAAVFSKLVSDDLAAAEESDDDDGDDAARSASGRGLGEGEGLEASSTALADGDDSPLGGAGAALEVDEDAAVDAACMRAERDFNVKATLDRAVPRVVATAGRVVEEVLARFPAGAFASHGDVSGDEMRRLLAALADEMGRAACVAEWVFTSDADAAAEEEAATGSSANGNGNGNVHSQWPQQYPLPATPSLPSVPHSGDAARTGAEEGDDDIVRFPAGSTVMLGPDGRPVPKTGHCAAPDHNHHHHHHHQAGRNGNGSATTPSSASRSPGAFDLARGGDMLASFGGADSLTAPEFAAEQQGLRRAARRQELLTKQQSAGFFQELIHSSSFHELCLQYAEEMLGRALYMAADITGVRGYDAARDRAKMLLVIAALEGHRQRLLDTTEYAVGPSLRLFCAEVVRSTCSQSSS